MIKKGEIWKDYDQNKMMKPVITVKNIVNEQLLFPFLYICNSQTSLASMDLMQPSGVTAGVNFVKLRSVIYKCTYCFRGRILFSSHFPLLTCKKRTGDADDTCIIYPIYPSQA